MSWWNNVINAVRQSHESVVAPQYIDEDRTKKATLTSPEWVTNPQFGSPRRIDFTELEDYERDITVQAAKNFIIDSVATSEWEIVSDDIDDVVDNTEAVNFFNAADWEESFSTVLRGVISDTLLYDSGVIVLGFPKFCYDENKQLIKSDVPPLNLRARDGRSFIKQVSVYGDIIKYWQYSFLNRATAPIEFVNEEIIYIQESPSTRSPYGTSKLDIVKNVADLMIAVQEGHRAEQENSLQPGGVISHPNINDTTELKRRSALYNSQLKGEHNKGRWLVTGGLMEMTPINATTSDATWIPGAEWYQQQILSIFKVPRTILGFTSSDVNRATSISQGTSFKRNGVSTMLTLLEDVFTREIVKKYFSDKLSFRFVREIDLSDESLRADIDSKNVQTGIITVNELRLRDGREEIEEPEIEEPEVPGFKEATNEEGETPEEKAEPTEKQAVNIDKIEDASAREQQVITRAQEREILDRLNSIYGL